MRRGNLFVIVLLAFGLVAGSANANLLSNGGFETDGSGWIDWGVSDWGVWGSSGYLEGSDPDGGDQCVKLWWDDTGLWQDFTASAGAEYEFSIMVYNLSTNPSTWNGMIRAEFYDASDAKLAESQLDRFYSGTDAYDTWVEIGDTIVAPTGTTYGRFIFQNADWFDGVGGDLYYDDASVVLVPEPATIALLGLGLTLIVRKK